MVVWSVRQKTRRSDDGVRCFCVCCCFLLSPLVGYTDHRSTSQQAGRPCAFLPACFPGCERGVDVEIVSFVWCGVARLGQGKSSLDGVASSSSLIKSASEGGDVQPRCCWPCVCPPPFFVSPLILWWAQSSGTPSSTAHSFTRTPTTDKGLWVDRPTDQSASASPNTHRASKQASKHGVTLLLHRASPPPAPGPRRRPLHHDHGLPPARPHRRP